MPVVTLINPDGAPVYGKSDSNGNLLVSGVGSGGGTTTITDGTNTVNVLKSDGTAAGQNAELVAGTYLSVPFTTTTVGMVPSAAGVDVGNYRWVSVQITSQGTSSSVTFQASNDGSTWNTVALMAATNLVGTGLTQTTSATGIYHAPLEARYFRINVTGISAGITAGTIVFSALPSSLQGMPVAATQVGTWTVGSNSATGSAVPANAFYMAGTNSSSNLVGFSNFSPSDSFGNTGGLVTDNQNLVFNGTNWDRKRSNFGGVVTAAGTTTTLSAQNISTYNARGLVILVNITAGAGNVTVTINGITTSSYVYPLLVSTALAGTGVVALRVFPAATPSANLAANDILPRTIQVSTVVSGSITYGIDYVLAV